MSSADYRSSGSSGTRTSSTSSGARGRAGCAYCGNYLRLYDDRRPAKLNCIRLIQFILCTACFVLTLIIFDTSDFARLTFTCRALMLGVSGSLMVLTGFDIIASLHGRPIWWTHWLMFATMALLLCCCTGGLILGAIKHTNLIIVAFIVFFVTALFFIIDILILLKFLFRHEFYLRFASCGPTSVESTVYRQISVQESIEVKPRPATQCACTVKKTASDRPLKKKVSSSYGGTFPMSRNELPLPSPGNQAKRKKIICTRTPPVAPEPHRTYTRNEVIDTYMEQPIRPAKARNKRQICPCDDETLKDIEPKRGGCSCDEEEYKELESNISSTTVKISSPRINISESENKATEFPSTPNMDVLEPPEYRHNSNVPYVIANGPVYCQGPIVGTMAEKTNQPVQCSPSKCDVYISRQQSLVSNYNMTSETDETEYDSTSRCTCAICNERRKSCKYSEEPCQCQYDEEVEVEYIKCPYQTSVSSFEAGDQKVAGNVVQTSETRMIPANELEKILHSRVE